MKKRIKIQGFLIVFAVAVSVFFAKFFFRYPVNAGLDKFLDAAGILIFLLGFLFRIAARGYKAETSQESRKLVVSGPYRLVRNPMYLGTFLIGTGIILTLFVWWVFFLFLAVCLMIYVPQVRREENILHQRFGKDYEDYCKAVPRFMPALGKANLRDCLSFRVEWVKKEISSLAGAVIFIFAVKFWKTGSLAMPVFLVVIFIALLTALFYEEDTSGKN